jgi:hypothetical protein
MYNKEEKTMSKFWITFIVNEALSVVAAFIASGKMKPDQKAAAEKLIVAGEAFVATL